jgi:hypothetical protein
MEKLNAFRPRLLDDLRDPARLWYTDAAGDSRRRVREELQTMLFSRDPILRERICTALKRYYPHEVDPRCSGAKEDSAQR